MTDHKFTDEEEEVINVLCFYVDRQCNNCDIDDSACCVCCINTTIRDALTLINRQKAEIESLQAVNADMNESLRLAAEANKDMQAEIERLNKEVDRLSQCVLYHDGIVSDLEKDVFNAKSEAIKEFAERLKPKLSYYDEVYVDALVKEMTEENNESQNT